MRDYEVGVNVCVGDNVALDLGGGRICRNSSLMLHIYLE